MELEYGSKIENQIELDEKMNGVFDRIKEI